MKLTVVATSLGDNERDDLNGEPAQALSGEQGEQHAEQADLQGERHCVQNHHRDESARRGRGPEVQRRLIRYAVVVPAMKEIALAGVPRPNAIKITSSPKSTIAENRP